MRKEMGLDRAPNEFQTFYFSHVLLVPPSVNVWTTFYKGEQVKRTPVYLVNADRDIMMLGDNSRFAEQC